MKTTQHAKKKVARGGSSTTPKVDQRVLDIKMAGNQLELEQQVHDQQVAANERKKAEQSNKEKYYQERRQYYSDKREQQESREQQRRQQEMMSEISDSTSSLSASVKKGVSTLYNTQASSSGFHVGSLDISWGMFFLIMIFVLWLAVVKAPNHNNDSRLVVIWKAFVGQEEIA